MIVEELFENSINVYVDAYVFVADKEQRVWGFGDGEDSVERTFVEASRRGMTSDEFVDHYHGICNGVAGWNNERWIYRYDVVALESNGSLWLRNIIDLVEQEIAGSGISQDKIQCQDMLKKYISVGEIRMFGLCVKKYIYDLSRDGKRRIVYQMNELAPYEIEALIPEQVFLNAHHERS